MITDRKTIVKWLYNHGLPRGHKLPDYIMRKQANAYKKGYKDGFHAGYETASWTPASKT